MKILLSRVTVPAMSTLGYGWGTNEVGEVVKFAGDHRPMMHLGEALQASWEEWGEGIWVDIDSWQILEVKSAHKSEREGN